MTAQSYVRTQITRARLAASNLGVSVEEYLARRSSGQKRCTACKAWVAESEFAKDKSRSDGLSYRCRACSKKIYRETYVPVAPEDRKPVGKPRSPGRDGDKALARLRVSKAIGRGVLPHPSTAPCMDCGHFGVDVAHEHDHYLGYADQHHLAVQVVCRPCHLIRETKRGTYLRRKKMKPRQSEAFILALADGPKHRRDLAIHLQRSEAAIVSMTSRLAERGIVRRPAQGMVALVLDVDASLRALREAFLDPIPVAAVDTAPDFTSSFDLEEV